MRYGGGCPRCGRGPVRDAEPPDLVRDPHDGRVRWVRHTGRCAACGQELTRRQNVRPTLEDWRFPDAPDRKAG